MIERETNIPIALIVAMAQNRCIGIGGALPWRLADDLKFFKATTTGKPVIMGRKTFESIGKALPGRDNIVITRQDDFAAPDVTVAHSLEDAIAIAEAFAIARGAGEIMVIGGGEIYAEALPLAATLYLTEVAVEVDGDTFFPNIGDEWQAEEQTRIEQSDRNDHNAVICVLQRSAD